MGRTAQLIVVSVWLASVPDLQAVQKGYFTATFVEVQQKTRDRVDTYLVNTPLITAVPYFEVTVELKGMRYVAEYTPRRSGEELPEAWKAGESVKVRVEKHHLYLQRPDGDETQFVIAKKTPVNKEKSHE